MGPLEEGLETDPPEVDTKFFIRILAWGAILESNHERVVEGMSASVSICIPPAGSSDGSWNLRMLTPGRLLKALNVTTLLSDTFSKTVPSAVTRSFGVEMVQSKLWVRSNAVANAVNL